ncbi:MULTISPECIES: hypothetical protein [unclassified Moorena]|nr:MULTISPECIES: hypothetical protein [unclassified Moorena]NEP33142.1 hypothetical protein [Moorena sp. SIO3B2]NEQ06698.1 hypothetical protein [Moorena sp. SIO4E2]NES46280.1 hypothetical protein [Moorena sp. SIO2C4]
MADWLPARKYIRLRGSCREQGTADHRNSGQELTQSDAEVRPVANLIRRL